jgi:hypothetical protein
MKSKVEIEQLKAVLADKKAMLAAIDAGKFTLGAPHENRESNIRRQIAEIEAQLRKCDASRS